MGRVHQWHWSSGGRFTRRSSTEDNKESSSSSSSGTNSSAGCMSGVLNLFDFHQFQFPMSNQPCFKPNSSSATLLQQEDLQTCTVISKGVQAPRNSLESEEGSELFAKLSPQPSSRNMKDHHEHLIDDHDPAEVIQVVSTKPVKLGTVEVDHRNMARIRVVDELSSSDQSSIGSPGLPKTPTLVARLMGLDLLPENGSPSPSMSSNKPPNSAQSHHRINAVQSRQPLRQIHKTNNKTKFEDASITGTRSLPETPRISSARKSDVDASRFSLQINKENAMEELDYLSRASSTRDHQRRREHYFNYRHEEEMNRSPSQYARQLVKQVKESVSRRVAGLDITNTTRENNADRTEALAPKSKKQKRPTKNSGGGHEDQSTSSSKHSTNSPRIRSTEQKSIKSQTSDQQQFVPHTSNAAIATKSTHQQRRNMDKCKKASCERFTQRREAVMKNRASSAGKANLNIQEQKKSKKNTPLSIKDLGGGGAVVNKEQQQQQQQQSIPSTTPAQSPIVSSQTHQLPCSSSKPSESTTHLSSISSPNSYQPHQQQLQLLQFESRDDKINKFRYVTEILKRTGLIERDSSSSSSSLSSIVSPSHPLDPSIFDCLEQRNWSSQRHDRRLVFDLVDEILSEILRPYLIAKPWLRFLERRNERIRSGEELVQQIWSRIGRFPNANCQILQDIDDLIEQDLPNSSSTLSNIVSEEYESVVAEIERDLLDTLLLEISRR
ncbi:hypothetical protein Sjap_020731 [Stephania japonica]|uniref:DUF4378 domain-containing protein n=1 Tax=Stephania japonica TaxID=461633 RepID=A0AAP0F408_9MAGN